MKTTTAPPPAASPRQCVRKVREALLVIGRALNAPTPDAVNDAGLWALRAQHHAPTGSALRTSFALLEGRLRLLDANLVYLAEQGKALADSPTCVAQLQRARAALAETVTHARAWEESR